MSKHSMAGPLVILVGLFLLAGNLDLLATTEVRRFWPLLLVGLGLFLVARRRCGCGYRCVCERSDA